MTQIVSVSISREFYDKAKENHIKWSEAMRVGLSMMFAERDISDYDNNLNLYRKMQYFKGEAEKALKQLADLTNSQNEIRNKLE